MPDPRPGYDDDHTDRRVPDGSRAKEHRLSEEGPTAGRSPSGGTPARVVCVPGLGLEAAAWRATDRAWQARRRTDGEVRALPGYGRRPQRGEDLRPSALGARLADRLPDRTVLLGHSASCQVVVRAASLVPDRVAAVVLVGPTTDPRAARWRALVARWLRTAAWERPWQVPFLVRSYTRTGLTWMARTMDLARREDVRSDLRAVRCPVLVVRGRHDRICPEDWARDLAALGPEGSMAVTLPRGGHMVPLTHGDLVASAVASWLGTVQASASVASSTNAGSSSRSP